MAFPGLLIFFNLTRFEEVDAQIRLKTVLPDSISHPPLSLIESPRPPFYCDLLVSCVRCAPLARFSSIAMSPNDRIHLGCRS